MLFGLGGRGSVITMPNKDSSGRLWGALYWTPCVGIMYSPWPTANCLCLSLVLCGCLIRFLCLPPPPPPPSFRGLCGCDAKRSIVKPLHCSSVAAKVQDKLNFISQAWLDGWSNTFHSAMCRTDNFHAFVAMGDYGCSTNSRLCDGRPWDARRLFLEW